MLFVKKFVKIIIKISKNQNAISICINFVFLNYYVIFNVSRVNLIQIFDISVDAKILRLQKQSQSSQGG